MKPRSQVGRQQSQWVLLRGLAVMLVVLLMTPDARSCICVGPSLQIILDEYRFAASVRVVSEHEVVSTRVYLGSFRVGEHIRLVRAPELDPLEIGRECCDESTERAQIGKEYILAMGSMPAGRVREREARTYMLLAAHGRLGDFLTRLHTEKAGSVESKLLEWGAGRVRSRDFGEWMDTTVISRHWCSQGYLRAFLGDMALVASLVDDDAPCSRVVSARMRSDQAAIALRTFRFLLARKRDCADCVDTPSWLRMPHETYVEAERRLFPCPGAGSLSNPWGL